MTPSTATAPALITESRGGVVRLTLNRPDRRNALSWELLEALEAAQEQVADDNSARVVVVSGNGRAFCSGQALGEMIDRSANESRRLFTFCSSVMRGFRRLPQPVIARVHRAATAAGCQLVAACDLAVAAEPATFAT